MVSFEVMSVKVQMQKIMRLPRFVFPLFLTAFIIGGPTLVLYTAGYRLNLKTFNVEQVGFLLVDGNPKDVSVTLQGVQLGTKLPLYHKRLAPDTYNLSISHPDYFTYDTRITVQPRQSVVVSPVILIQHSVPVLLLEGDYTIIGRIPGTDTLILSTKTEHLETVTTFDTVKKISKSFSGSTQSQTDDEEIFISHGFDIVNKKTGEPLIRMGHPITSFTSIFKTPYVAAVHENQLILINSKDSAMSPLTLFESSDIQRVTSNVKGTELLWTGTIGATKGLFSLTLRGQ